MRSVCACATSVIRVSISSAMSMCASPRGLQPAAARLHSVRNIRPHDSGVRAGERDDAAMSTAGITDPAQEPELISAEEGASRVADGALLIDVRSEATRKRVGALSGAVVVDRERLPELFGDDSPE